MNEFTEAKRGWYGLKIAKGLTKDLFSTRILLPVIALATLIHAPTSPAYAEEVSLGWAMGIGSTNQDWSLVVERDALGNVYIAGKKYR